MHRLILVVLPVLVVGTAAQTAPRAASSDGADDNVQNAHYFRPTDYDNNDDAEKLAPSFWPHPYMSLQMEDMPGGYFPVAAYGEIGLTMESHPGIVRSYFGYDNGHKTDDADQPNPKGHDRYLHGELYGRLLPLKLPKWYVGGGYRWSQLSTTNYTKGGGRPFLGLRYDLYMDRLGSRPDCGECWFSARFGLDYFTAGSDWQNGSHGLTFSMVMPRPSEKRHIFLDSSFDLSRFHETVTDRTNIPLTNAQLGNRSFDGSCSAGILYRFW